MGFVVVREVAGPWLRKATEKAEEEADPCRMTERKAKAKGGGCWLLLSHPSAKARMDGAPASLTETAKKKQVPRGNDRKKGNGNGKAVATAKAEAEADAETCSGVSGDA
jgi:hypothetical protein